MAFKWLNKLQISYLHLARRALELNEKDKFVMKYDPEEVERRKRKEQEERERERESRERIRKEKNKSKEHYGYSLSLSSAKKLSNASADTTNANSGNGSTTSSSRLPSTSDISFNQNAKHSRTERVVSPDFLDRR